MVGTIIGLAPAPPNPKSNWRSACETFAMAQADLRDVESDEELGIFAGAQMMAMMTMLLTPAPDVAALARKLEVFRDEEAYGHIDETLLPIFAALVEDAHCLANSPRCAVQA